MHERSGAVGGTKNLTSKLSRIYLASVRKGCSGVVPRLGRGVLEMHLAQLTGLSLPFDVPESPETRVGSASSDSCVSSKFVPYDTDPPPSLQYLSLIS